MKKLLFMLALLALFIVACQAAPVPPVAESPKEIAAPETPAVAPPTTPPIIETAPADCKTDCIDSCTANTDKVCGQGTDWYGCLDNCDGLLRPEGCKAVCSTESYQECSPVFRGECKQECGKKCPIA
ncbi:hypothetical protein HY492_01835 [Candidatus Woesearchaeota archaeon]|nr:hypothetical protein [Candidatus Woesearchaeota archaeon]